MERSIDVRTGESIAVEYELAGLGSRFLAVTIDMIIQIVILVGFVLLFATLGGPIGRAVQALHLSGKTASALAIALFAIGTFVLFFGYFIIFEVRWHGQTPGKRILGVRVVRDAGFPLDIGGSVIRNLVRIIELGIGFYAVSAIVTLFSKQNKRVGDMAAGTIVVRDRRYELAGIDAYLRTASVPADDGVSAEDRVLIERFLARRGGLARDARVQLAAQIAARVRPSLRASFEHLSDESLLEHLGR